MISGYVLGGGVEFALSQNVNMHVEGLSYTFDDETYRQPGDPGDKMTIQNSVVVGRIGFAYKF
jgi:opacity protein-like surface antigen